MCTRENLAQCGSVFDIAAVLYRACEDRTGDRRFHKLMNALHSEPALIERFLTSRQGLELTLARPFEEAGIRELRDGLGPVDVQMLARWHSDFQRWLHGCGFDEHIADWALLSSIDASFTPEHTNDLRTLYDSTLVEPLNNNWSIGLPKVFLKISSSITMAIAPLIRHQRKVSSSLGYLAIVDDLDPDIQIRLDAQLWTDLSEVPLTLAVISPWAERDHFRILSADEESALVGVFWVKADEPQEYRRRVLQQLRSADNALASIAVLPELSSSSQLEEEVSRERFTNLRLIVLGSRHLETGDGNRVNRCLVLGRGGEVVWQQCKRERFVMPETIPPDYQILHPHQGEEEGIGTEYPQTMMLTPVGGMAVQICLDFLQEDVRNSLCRLGCRWFFLPVADHGLGTKFERAMCDCGEKSGAVGAIANNRCVFLWEQKLVQAKELRRFYEPRPNNPHRMGTLLSKGIWLFQPGIPENKG